MDSGWPLVRLDVGRWRFDICRDASHSSFRSQGLKQAGRDASGARAVWYRSKVRFLMHLSEMFPDGQITTVQQYLLWFSLSSPPLLSSLFTTLYPTTVHHCWMHSDRMLGLHASELASTQDIAGAARRCLVGGARNWSDCMNNYVGTY